MIVVPVAIAPGPAVPDSGQPEPIFDAQYEAFNAWERNTAAPGMNALANATYQNALEAKARAESASASEEAVLASRNAAAVSAEAASFSAGTANTKAGEASASAFAAGNSAASASASAAAAAASAVDAQGYVASVNAAPGKETPVGADKLGYLNSEAGGSLVGLTFDQLRAWISSLFVEKAGDVMTGDLGVPGLNGGQLAGLRNKIINGNFDVWQRGTSFSAGNIYTADRWAAGGATGQTVNRVADHPTAGSSGYCLEIANTSGSQWLYQRIESINIRDLVGKTVTASCWVKTVVAGGGAQLMVVRANGVDDWSGSTDIGASVYTSSTSWTRLTYSFTVTAAMANGLMLRVITSGGAGGAATVRVAMVQLEVGPAATSFEHRPYGLELVLCQRYYCRFNTSNIDSTFSIGFVGSTTQMVGLVKFPVNMRITPTSLEQSGVATDYAIGIPGANVICSAVPTYSARTTTDHAQFAFTVASGLTAGNSAMAKSATTGAFLGFSAEL